MPRPGPRTRIFNHRREPLSVSQPTHTFKFPARDVDSAKPDPYQLRLSLSPIAPSTELGLTALVPPQS